MKGAPAQERSDYIIWKIKLSLTWLLTFYENIMYVNLSDYILIF